MEKINIAVLFGGVSPEHEVSLRSAQSILSNIDREKYQVFPIGITKAGKWVYYGGTEYDALPDGSWIHCEENREAVISPSRTHGMLLLAPDGGVRMQRIDCVFPVLHGENGEDGSVQGLMQLAGIPCVGPGVGASAAAMDKTLTKLVADEAGVRQAAWYLVRFSEFCKRPEDILSQMEGRFAYPMFVKPAGTGSSVGVSKASDRAALIQAIDNAGAYDEKILVEEFVDGREIEVAVLGNEAPIASCCGEIVANAEFYDYDAKYVSDCAKLWIPAEIPEESSDALRHAAVRIYKALGCRGLSRVDFFLTRNGGEAVFNEINTLPGFTSISMYPKLFAQEGISYADLIDRIIGYAMEQ